MAVVMAFIGHGGRNAGSYVSFHAKMLRSARQIDCLPSAFLKKDGLRRMAANIGVLVMTAAAGRDVTMHSEPVGVAHIRNPFFPTGTTACDELKLFDKDMEEAKSKARLHEDYGDDEDGNFRSPNDSHHRRDWHAVEQPPKKQPRLSYAGAKLELFAVYLTKHGFIFGCKFLVIVDTTTLPENECVACFSYSTSEERRAEWCCKNGCTSHPRPGGLSEDKFHVINIHAADNASEDARLAKDVLDTQSSWIHVAGPKNLDVMGGIGGRRWGAANSTGRAAGNGSGRGGGGRGGGGKGKGGGGKGRSKGKGKGGKDKGGRSPNFGRQR